MKKEVFRRCIVTQEILSKEELFRVVKTPLNEIKVDTSYRLEGRGAYLKKDLKVILEAQKKSALSRALKTKLDDNIYLELISILAKGE